MHVLVLVLGDNVEQQLNQQYPKHVDFWCVGGRWHDFLPKRRPDGTIRGVESLRAGEIAWEEALAETEAESRESFAAWREVFERHGKPKSRHEIAEELGLGLPRYGRFPEQVYAVYREQPAMRAFDEAHPGNIYCPINLFGFDEEKFVREQVAARMSPFALVIGGKWFGGEVSLDKVNQDWAAAVQDRLRSLDPDTLVTVADCHF